MRRARPFCIALWVLALAWASGTSPNHADAAPNPLPSASATPATLNPFPSASAAPAAPTPTPQATSQLSNPFPSPSPSAQTVTRNGYFAAGYVGGSASGGEIEPLPNATSTPFAFPASGASGFWIDLLGRIAPSFLAQILYDNLSVHGGDRPLVSYAQGRLLYQPSESRAALGVGFISVQRSTSNANSNGIGVGASLLPDLRGGMTPYASVFFYPHLQTNGVGASLTSADAGIMYAPKGRGGLFFRLGGSLRSGAPANTSPTSVTGLQFGLGSAF
jgi:hypothetical protein